MNVTLLREWFHLPPGNWPPTDRELIGLPPIGDFDSAMVEIKALERMDELRPRQLVHPELVTEGMNRLAQALIALTATAPVAPANANPLAPRLRKPEAQDAKAQAEVERQHSVEVGRLREVETHKSPRSELRE